MPCYLMRSHAPCATLSATLSGKRGFPVSELKLFASARSAGKDMKTPFGQRGICSLPCAREAFCMPQRAVPMTPDAPPPPRPPQCTGDLKIEEFSLEAARDCDVVFLAVSGDFAEEWAEKIAEGDAGTLGSIARVARRVEKSEGALRRS